MDLPIETLAETIPAAHETRITSSLLPLDPNETPDLHRAINERRAQVENPELLKHLRSM